ncbi:hypothetical protein [Lentibacillus jeotgali]|uniref:hypothetical protein n=1 Tax=Lentibacillus jeotgali TaxID=558169 RepID=UPI0002625C77|nr:hypothetical protein [Lentibacillus jeotgali]
MSNKKPYNLQSEQGSKMIINIVEKSLAGITVKEIMELKKLCAEDRYEYYNRIKLKYITLLLPLGFNFLITEEVEKTIFFFIHDIIHQISVTGIPDKELEIQIS